MEIDRFIPMNLKQNNNKLSGDDSLTKIVLSKRVFKNNCTHTHIYIYIYTYVCMHIYDQFLLETKFLLNHHKIVIFGLY